MQLCRLCLKNSELCVSLFTGGILNKIESLTSIKIAKGDNLPQTCCESCAANVYSSYKFQQTIIKANETLLSLTSDNLQFLVDTEGLQMKQEIKEEASSGEERFDDDLNSNSSRASSTLEISDLVMLDYKKDESEDNTKDILENCDEIIYDLDDSQVGEVSSESEDFECLQCGAKFSSKKSLQQHMAKHKVDSCPFCQVVMRRDNLKKHIQIHTDSPEVCEICGKLAKNKESLRGHMNYAHKKKAKIKCKECGKEFKSTHHYNTHFRNVHLGIRNHQCDICGKKFFSNYDLNKHITMTHKKARPYECSYCGKGFSSPYARKTHIRQHTLETPYHCDICTAGFRQKVSLLTHIRSKHSTMKKENN
ncbi:hypothetical protein PPYR_07517 [Photinus pyralis]|uniref:Protein krueppel n=1 Tax=Photinus pyralis TaxID=7054 RepID=A0A1Y1L1Y5_PHOPY|nr:gastrula zinc finger protein XlCGF8.2DB-like [Photinus pyralis]XP_031348598.1 gastrula zinc finger protein XlCGF8.2DB-like [Photinus pyralis]KAB0796135.1 hypothetical protein PPYR_10196 [Photinus pyralis]KAB0799637.1 hypothetical protein PPYR_07517 [Photinus pyralis]